MTFESFQFVTGELIDIGRREQGYGAPLAITISGPDGPWGAPLPHRVLIYNARRSEQLLNSDTWISDMVQAETCRMRFVRGVPGSCGGHFVSELAAGGVLEKVSTGPATSIHYLSGILTGTSDSPPGGVEVRIREKRSFDFDPCDYVFRLSGASARAFMAAGIAPGGWLLVSTSDVRPAIIGGSGIVEFTGTGFTFFQFDRKGKARGVRRARKDASAGDSPAAGKGAASAAMAAPPGQDEPAAVGAGRGAAGA
jgi:hypothetical protein